MDRRGGEKGSISGEVEFGKCQQASLDIISIGCACGDVFSVPRREAVSSAASLPCPREKLGATSPSCGGHLALGGVALLQDEGHTGRGSDRPPLCRG